MEKIPNQDDITQYIYRPENNERKDNMVRVETPSAVYNIIYSNHGVQNHPEDIFGSDGVIMEGILGDVDTNDIENILRKQMELNRQYGQVIRYASEHNIPLYMADISEKSDTGSSEIITKKIIAPIVGGYLSYRFLKSSISDIAKKPVTRRSFLKNFGKTVAAAYLSTPAVELASSEVKRLSDKEINESDVSRNIQRHAAKINNSIHPELNTLTLEGRNSLIAMKSDNIAKNLSHSLGRKPNISLIIGGRHIGIEESLKISDKERLDELREYLDDEQIDGEKTIFEIEWDNQKPVVSKTEMD